MLTIVNLFDLGILKERKNWGKNWIAFTLFLNRPKGEGTKIWGYKWSEEHYEIQIIDRLSILRTRTI